MSPPDVEARFKSSHWVSVIIAGLLTFGLAWLALFSMLKWIRRIGPEGVTLRTGRLLRWKELKLVRPVYLRSRYSPKGSLQRIELMFGERKAVFYAAPLQNGDALLAALEHYTRAKFPATYPTAATR
jgi:hypothetical protein